VTISPEPVWKVGALLGEGPIWLPGEQALRFVDIKRGCLHRYHPSTGACETFDVSGQPSFIVPSSGGELLVGSDHGVFRLENGLLGTLLAAIPQPEGNRTNDATVDAAGRLWFGTMDDREELATGTIWCLAKDSLHRMDCSAIVTNGPAVSADGQYLFHVDSGERVIWRSALSTGPTLEHSEVFVRLDAREGHPDGIVVDAEDCLWVALWDGWGVRRYAPDGALLLHVAFPCARVTKIALGGPDLRTAYATTARIGLDEAALAEQPLAGSLFAFEAPAPGRVLPSVCLA
jgi:sugar lactone lactonase YvrE